MPANRDIATGWLRRNSIIILLSLVLLGGAGVLRQLTRQQTELYHGMALQGTSLQASSLLLLRQLYTEEVATRVHPLGIEVTHDYELKDNAIPLPATLTMKLGEAINQVRPGAHFRLYSDYPFPWRTDRAPADDFQASALAALRLQPERPFYRFEDFEGRPSLRYAVADRMQANCVSCHNAHPDSPKRDWKVGDVRGVLEVIRPLDNLGPIAVASVRGAGRWLFGIAVLLFTIGALGLAAVTYRLYGATTRLTSSERQLSDLFQNATVGIQLLDRSGVVLDANAAQLEILGFARDEYIGTPIRNVCEEPQLIEEALSRLALGENVGRYETQLRTKHGTTCDVVIDFNVLRRGGEFVYARCFITNITDRKRAERLVVERTVLAQFAADVGVALTHGGDLRSMIQSCCEAVVKHLDAAFARIWTLNDLTNTLELHGSAGMYTHIDGDHARVPVGKFKIGLIAQERKAHLTNSVVGDPRVGNQEWAMREGMVAFAGYPLMIGNRVIGVMAMFARHPLSELVTDAMASVGDTVALGIEQHRAAEALRHSERLATSANIAKSAFLANMSHEIRTPMSAIVGYADLLADRAKADGAPDDASEAVQAIQRNGAHLLTLINDILDLSKIEAGKFSVEKTDCRLDSLVADVCSTLRVRAVEKKLDMGVECIGPVPRTIRSDPARLRQILMNLLGNAIKFTESGGVRLIVRTVDPDAPNPHLQFDFVDSGVGLTAEQAARVFQPFVQGDDSTTRRFGGTGLGLAISKRLAEMLGGDVVIADTAPGVGTRFRLIIDPGPLGNAEMLNHLPVAVTIDTLKPKAPANQIKRLQSRVLLAEDGVDNQRLIMLLLGRAGAQVTLAENGRIALDMALSAWRCGRPFDVILMDMQMPEMDGYEATRTLRRESYQGPIIALTAHAMSGDREKSIEAGCDDYATKPIDRARLIDLIDKYTCHRAAALTAGAK